MIQFGQNMKQVYLGVYISRLKLSFQTLLRGNGGSVKCLNIGTYANGFILSSEALKSVISVIFAHVAPD